MCVTRSQVPKKGQLFWLDDVRQLELIKGYEKLVCGKFRERTK